MVAFDRYAVHVRAAGAIQVAGPVEILYGPNFDKSSDYNDSYRGKRFGSYLPIIFCDFELLKQV